MHDDETIHPQLRELVAGLGRAVRAGRQDPEAVVAGVQDALRSAVHSSGWLPASCTETDPECYARHLVHCDPQDCFSVVAMVWNVGQKTPVHDHAGVWCVEGVYEGRIGIVRYDLVEKHGRIARFRRHEKIEEGVGATGALIPPSEYHAIENCDPQRPAITVHVYGCDMKACHVYVPREDGSYETCEKALHYTSVWNRLSPASVPAR